MNCIIVLGGKNSARLRPFLLARGTSLVGRSPKCQIVLSDGTVSRTHAKIVVADSSVKVIDLGSRNGTFLNDKRIDSSVVESNQQIRFGKTMILVCLCSSDSSETGSELLTEDGETLQGPHRLLTHGQERIFQLLVKPLTEKQIAVQLDISHHTVHNHVRAIYRVFSVASRTELFARLLLENAETNWSGKDT
jgi:pSer/pThr/pTyr-binding forkhead associated (FHA) protein